MSKKVDSLKNEITKLQTRAKELTTEKGTLETAITQKTQALSASLLAGKEDDRLLNDLTKKRLRLDAVQGAILQAGEEVKRLSAEIAAIDLAEAEKQLSALDKQAEKIMIDIKAHIDAVFDLIDEMNNNQSAASQLFNSYRIDAKPFQWVKNSSKTNWLREHFEPLRIDINRFYPSDQGKE